MLIIWQQMIHTKYQSLFGLLKKLQIWKKKPCKFKEAFLRLIWFDFVCLFISSAD